MAGSWVRSIETDQKSPGGEIPPPVKSSGEIPSQSLGGIPRLGLLVNSPGEISPRDFAGDLTGGFRWGISLRDFTEEFR